MLLADWGDPGGIAAIGGLVTAVIALAALGVSLRAQLNAETDRRALREEQRQLVEERRRDRVRRVWIVSIGITSGVLVEADSGLYQGKTFGYRVVNQSEEPISLPVVVPRDPEDAPTVLLRQTLGPGDERRCEETFAREVYYHDQGVIDLDLYFTDAAGQR